MRTTLRYLTSLGLLLGALALPSTAFAHPEDCTADQADHSHGDGEICLSQSQIDGFDDSGASLGAGESAITKNLHLLANLPKSGVMAGDRNYNSDLAFQDQYVYQGNYNGIQVTNISDPENPVIVKQVLCPGAQNDISVYGDLLITSTDSSRNKPECEGNVFQTATNPDSWEGIRVFDISDPADPQYVTAVETDCGSHTHTLVPDLADGRLLVYVSSYGPNAAFPDCQPPHDKISIVEVPLANPGASSVIAEPVLFPDGGNPGDPDTRTTQGCHDITAYPAKGLAAGACMGEGVLLDISNPESPVVLDTVIDNDNMAFFHSATFTHDASKVIFTDELGGGGGPTCNPTVGDTRGANTMYEVGGGQFGDHLSYFKIPRTQHNSENCVAHNGMFLPTTKRDVYVQSWYQGGTSLVDYSDPTAPKEIGFFERGPFKDEEPITGSSLGGAWSSYWYRGKIYVSDIQMGLDVLNLSGKEKSGIGATERRLNPQLQEPPRK